MKLFSTTLRTFAARWTTQSAVGAVVLALTVAACGCRPSATSDAQLATATSYLESAALDVLGEGWEVLRLAEPGTCPGHFDIRPSQAAGLRRCRALLRFDFQSSLDRVLEGNGTNRPLVVAVTIRSDLCQPSSYFSACQQIADALVAGAANWIKRMRRRACELSRRV